jgi:hypothetical protein
MNRIGVSVAFLAIATTAAGDCSPPGLEMNAGILYIQLTKNQ